MTWITRRGTKKTMLYTHLEDHQNDWKKTKQKRTDPDFTRQNSQAQIK
jgi:hypothetical protein